MTDQELKDLVASLAIAQAETGRQIKELKQSQAETDRQIKELKQSQAETDRQIKELKQSQAETDRQIKELKQSQAQTDAQMKRTFTEIGGLGNSQGAVAEEFFYNSLAEDKMLAGIRYDFIDKHWSHRIGTLQDEFDIVMVNGQDVAIIEVKYKAREADLTRLLSKKLENFKQLFPFYKDYKHHLVLASFSLYDELKEKALAQGVTLLQRKGDIVETIVPEQYYSH